MPPRNLNLQTTITEGVSLNATIQSYDVDITADFITEAGEARQRQATERFPQVLNWLLTNHPDIAKELFSDLTLKIALVKHGVKEPESLLF